MDNIKYFKDDYIYDLETYKNTFTFAVVKADRSVAYVFEVSPRKDNRKEMFQFLDYLKQTKKTLVGFNNLAFDYPIIHFIMKHRRFTPEQVYEEAQYIIETLKEDKFGSSIQTRFHHIRQKDLFKINHFDNKAKSTSLKLLEFNMKMDNLQELPFDPHTNLADNQIDVLIKYNINDVIATLKFYYECYGSMELREGLSESYGIDFTNMNDTKIGSEIFIQEIEKVKPNSCYKKKFNGQREIVQTHRSYIDISKIIFPYIKFKRPEFQAILEWFKNQKITETNGVFSNILESDLGDVAKYANMVTKKSKKMDTEPTEEQIIEFRKQIPLAQVEVKELKSGKNKKSYYYTWKVAESLNVVINGHEYIFGVGGIHSSVSPQIIESNEHMTIVDWDVSSFYPNLAIKNNAHPAHLGLQFCKTYNDLYEKRKTYPKSSPWNAALKLALNGTFGKSNDKFSPFYDPQYTMTITINGQLSLCMLIERLLELDGTSSVQSNTDGITMLIKTSMSDKADEIVKQWEADTKLEMERNDYSKMFIRDVNSYVAVYLNGKTKLKGTYAYELENHKDQSSLIIQKAAVEFLSKGTKIEDYIMSHKDKYDFMLRTKLPRSSKLMSIDDFGNKFNEQNITRFYISNSDKAKTLIKIMPPVEGKEDERHIGIAVGYKAKICNNIVDFDWDIDYDYYIEECYKIVNFFMGKKNDILGNK